MYCFFGPISNISVLEFKRRTLLIIQSFTFLTHPISLDNLKVSSGLVISITMEINPIFSNNITKGQHVY